MTESGSNVSLLDNWWNRLKKLLKPHCTMMHILVILIVAAFVYSGSAAGLQLSGKATVQGTPEVNMWGCGMPKDGIVGAGYPILNKAEHVKILHATKGSGGYNHHPQLAHHNGRFYAAWSNQPNGEDAPGQRVLFSVSTDGIQWSDWRELFSPPDEIKEWGTQGFYLGAGPMRIHDGRLYGQAILLKALCWENADGTSTAAKWDNTHRYLRAERIGTIARQISPACELGPVFVVNNDVEKVEGLAFEVQASASSSFRDVADALRCKATSGPSLKGNVPQGIDKCRLCEPSVYQAQDGNWVCLLRDDLYSHRLYVSVSVDKGKTWSKAMPTNIPDSPSLTTSLKLKNGKILLIGSQCSTRFDNPRNPRHYGRNPLTVAVSEDGYFFYKAYSLRCGQQKFRVPDVHGRGGGPAYPSAIVVQNKLYVLYSMGKEDIWISIVPLAEIGI